MSTTSSARCHQRKHISSGERSLTSYGVLHLYPRINLEEDPLVRTRVEEELKSTQTSILQMHSHLHRSLQQRLNHCSAQRRWSHLLSSQDEVRAGEGLHTDLDDFLKPIDRNQPWPIITVKPAVSHLRCTLHSRSQRCITFPWPSPTICTSICFQSGPTSAFSAKICLEGLSPKHLRSNVHQHTRNCSIGWGY